MRPSGCMRTSGRPGDVILPCEELQENIVAKNIVAKLFQKLCQHQLIFKVLLLREKTSEYSFVKLSQY